MTVDELRDEAATARMALLAAADSVPEADRSRSPGADRWSVVEVLDHIDMTQTRILDLLERLASRAEAKGALQAVTMDELPTRRSYRGAISRYDVIPAFPGTEPSGRDESVIRDSLTESAPRLEGSLAFGATHDCSRLIAPHPIGRLNYYEWFLLIAEHDRVHTDQIAAIVADL